MLQYCQRVGLVRMLTSDQGVTPGLGWSGEQEQPRGQGGRGRAARCAPCRTFHEDLMNILMRNNCGIIVSRKGKYSRTSSRASHGPASTRTGSPCSNCTKRSYKDILLFCLWKQKWNNVEFDAVFALHVNAYVGMGVGIHVFMLKTWCCHRTAWCWGLLQRGCDSCRSISCAFASLSKSHPFISDNIGIERSCRDIQFSFYHICHLLRWQRCPIQLLHLQPWERIT